MKQGAEDLLQKGRYADAAERLDELVEGDAAGHLELGILWRDKLGRIDRALHHLRRAWELEQEPRAMAAMRALHTSLGDDDAAIRLYEEELATLPEGDARVPELELALGKTLARRGDLEAAARRLEACLARTRDERLRDVLAEVYAALAADGGAAERAVELCLELALSRRTRGDLDGAVTFLRRGLGVDPASAPLSDELAAVLAQAGRHAELARLYQARGMLAERARVLEEKLANREEAKRCWEALGPAGAARLRALYATDGDWAKLAALVERGLAGRAPAERRADLLELAAIAHDHLSDRERAAGYLRRLLDEDPTDAEAARRYADHFKERRDWRGLSDLQDKQAHAEAPPAERLRRLEELATTCETRLGDVERAAAAWREAAELDPENPRAREAIRRLGARTKMWESLIGVLEREVAAAPAGAARVEALRRMAGVYRERQVDPRRAIALYEEAIALAPGDGPTLKALGELYERQGDDAGVIRTLRRQLEAGPPQRGELTAPQRMERLAMVRRLSALAEQRVDVDAAVFACTGILELSPGDRDALDRLERVLDRSGDAAGIESALQYRAEVAAGPAERARVLRRLARIADGAGDPVESLSRWERVLANAPTDDEALGALARLYEGSSRWKELAAVLERRCDVVLPGEDETGRLARLHRYARVVEGHLPDAARAAAAWRRVATAQPRDRETLAALARHLEALGGWRELAEVLRRLATIVAVDDRPAAAELATRAADIVVTRLNAPAEAIELLEHACAEIAPGDRPAHERLARLCIEQGDVAKAVVVLERLAWLTHDPAERIAVLERIAALARDRLGDARRALHAFERVIEAAPARTDALSSAAELYALAGDWLQHVAALERLARLQDTEDRASTFLAIARVVEDQLGDAPDGFRWRWKAHQLLHAPDTLDELRAAAGRAGLWLELVEVLEAERGDARGDGARFVALSREIAGLIETRLGDPGRAIAVLGEAVAAAPEDESLHAEAERVAVAAGDDESWRAVLRVTQAALPGRTPAVRAALHERRSRILEQRLGDPSAALDERIAAFTQGPSPDAREEILRLAERTGRWEDALRIDGALYKQAGSLEDKALVLTRAAAIVDERIGDRQRAFRGYLRALRKAPDDAGIAAQLWRLAELIGTYDLAPARPRPPSQPTPPPRGESTIVLSADDLVEMDRPDATIQLKLEDFLDGGGAVSTPPRVPESRRGRFASAWEELAEAHAEVPADNLEARVRSLLRSAEVWEHGARDTGRAFEALMRARAVAPADPAPRARLVKLAKDHDEWDELARLLLRAADRARSAAESADLLHEAATIRVEHGAAPQAEGLYRRILGIQPEDARARAGLESLYRSESRWAELAAALEERADPRLSGARPEGERVTILDELAHLYDERLGNPYEAIAALDRLTALRPGDLDALSRLAVIFEKVGRWAKVVETLGRVAQVGERGPAARAARWRMAEIYENELELPARAAEVYSAITATWPDDAKAREGLGRVLAQLGRVS